ncbi:peptide chain release factor N(5)-glutamine methyltransferase [Naasia lichenicola]|uniref:Release factor glutamine methyltransferase n=2 Tax=Naasia lichenicola TaxID=2565933 RepID=A0A4S4FQY1_9MICO|nr:peptide chain release factor N(5)-glutamine methyltransferase [Naasia lichenicola]
MDERALERDLSVRAVVGRAIELLGVAGIRSPEVDAELLVGHAIGETRGRVQALAIMGRELPADAVDVIEQLVSRRAHREPLQHITGRAAFRTLELSVGPGVFVPRPETELVAQFAIDALAAVAAAEPIAVDLGTGSGALALAMAAEVPRARVWGVEFSPEAFIWATQNLRDTGFGNASIVFDDLRRALPELDGSVSVVVSNPPYIPSDAVPRDPEVRLFDPEMALYGGEDGLDLVRGVSATALRLLHPGGALVIEHGELQGEAIRALLRTDGWRAVSTHPDLTGRPRATTAVR